MLLGIIVFSFSCKVHKETKTTPAKNKIKQISDKKLLKKTNNNYLKYDNLTFKFNGKFAIGNTSWSIRGIIYTKRDSIIAISLYHSTGIPIAKIQMMYDSLIFLNQIENTYYCGDYDFFEDKLNFSLTFNNIQGIIFNELFLYNDTVTTFKELKDFVLYTDSSSYVLQSVKKKEFRKFYKKQRKNKRVKKKYREGFIVQNFNILPDKFKVRRLMIKDVYNKMAFVVNYSNFEPIFDKNFFRKMELNIYTPKDTIQADLKIKKITKYEKKDYNFKIPSKATLLE